MSDKYDRLLGFFFVVLLIGGFMMLLAALSKPLTPEAAKWLPITGYTGVALMGIAMGVATWVGEKRRQTKVGKED